MINRATAGVPGMRWAPAEPHWKAKLRERFLRVFIQGISSLAKAFPRRKTPPAILMYHRTVDVVAGVPAPTINVPPEQFRHQMEGLLQLGYQFWPLRRLLEACHEKIDIPDRVLSVTFDDGFESIYLNAFPTLRRLGIPATVFLPTAFIGQEEPFPFDHWGVAYWNRVPPENYRPMRWQQCQDGDYAELIDWGAHTHTHQDFRGRPEEFEEDLRECVHTLLRRLGICQPTFAFPYGSPHLGFVDEALMEAARRTGVCCALTTVTGTVTPHNSPFGWPRLNVFSFDSAATIDARVRGWYCWLPRAMHQLRSKLEAIEWSFRPRTRQRTNTADRFVAPSQMCSASQDMPREEFLPRATTRATAIVRKAGTDGKASRQQDRGWEVTCR